ncbi:MAG: hypothetical protein IJ168_05125 [Eubacterium sp.]|nr:hypothetical protein [Eubacterium sp.]
MDKVIFYQNDKYSYRDPAAAIFNGELYLFFSLVENDGKKQYFYVAMSRSKDLLHWSEPTILTERDTALNYSSPGNVVEHNGEYYLCVQSYPRPNGEKYGNENSRLYFMKTTDFINWSHPEMIYVKGDIRAEKMGRMIDPYVLKDGDRFVCFFKQNGVSFSESTDLKHWRFIGNAACGENVCVFKEANEYLIFNSPENGINLMSTTDFKNYKSIDTFYLNQSKKPWAKDRITAGFVIDISELNLGRKYAMFYHGDNEDRYLYGATLAVATSDDIRSWS